MTLARAAQAAAVAGGLAPWLVTLLRAWLPLGAAGVALDALFAPVCHRLPERSLVLAGVAMPVCSRCAGIFAGVALGALAAWPLLSPRGYRWTITLAALLMLADVVAQDAGLHALWHPGRLATGMAFGYAVGAACVSLVRQRARVV